MSTTQHNTERIEHATIEADPQLPTCRIVRDFDAPPEKLFRAWTDPALVARWMGPRSIDMDIHAWEATTGGSYRYDAVREGEVVASFYGSFHEVRPHERIVQTFTWEGMPDGVSLDILTFVDLGDGRTRVDSLSVLETIEGRDAMLASGMETGVHEGYAKLDELLGDL
jgi:uncharacterized protein YndB with AHSA1/START domain